MRKYLFIALFLLANIVSAFTQSSVQPGTIQPDAYSKNHPNMNGPVILRGTIILPQGMMTHGYVAIDKGLIVSVSEKAPYLPNAESVNTNGIILPGLVDVHNHVPFNVIPRWKPGRLFTNRNQWRSDPEVLAKINGPVGHIEPQHFCDMNDWGELRALVGGTTSIMVTHAQPCINGLVRNLDLNSGFYGTTELDREHIYNVLDFPPASDPSARAEFVYAATNYFIQNPFYKALFLHLAEGTDAASKEEFTFMETQSLLNTKGVVIHGIPLTAPDFKAMANKGTALVWSPRSNLELYGTTADIHAALNAGVEIALAPDWAVTGSSNLLNELKVADTWNRKRLGGRLTDRQLVDMATLIPAHIAGVDDQIGAIKAGLRADILVIKGKNNSPYRSVIDASAADVDLVFINGIPLYGDRNLMKQFWDKSDLEEIKLNKVSKSLATPAANIKVAQIEKRLQQALRAEGTSLAPLTESGDFSLSPIIASNGHLWPGTSNERILTTEAKELYSNNAFVYEGRLKVSALNNPNRNYFTIHTQSSSNTLLQVRLVDVFGRLIETRKGIVANSTFNMGQNVGSGVYFVEVIQGDQRQLLKLIRQ